MNRSLRSLTVGAATLLAAGGLVVSATPALAATAHAKAKSGTSSIPADSFEIDYQASGSSYIAKPKTTVALGPTVAKNYISDSGDGSFAAQINLPSTTASFKAVGLVPVKATVTLVSAGLVKGFISQDDPITLSGTATYYVKLSNVTATVLGLPVNLNVGSNCQTVAPVSIPIATPKGQVFDLTDGGNLTGTYTIGKFANCGGLFGANTALINALVPGSGNTASFTLSNGQFVDNS